MVRAPWYTDTATAGNPLREFAAGETAPANASNYDPAAGAGVNDLVKANGKLWLVDTTIPIGPFVEANASEVGGASLPPAPAFTAGTNWKEGDLFWQAGKLYHVPADTPAAAFNAANFDLVGPAAGAVKSYTAFTGAGGLTADAPDDGTVGLVVQGASVGLYHRTGSAWQKSTSQTYFPADAPARTALSAANAGLAAGDRARQVDDGSYWTYNGTDWDEAASGGGSSATYATTAALLADTPPNGTIGYVPDTAAAGPSVWIREGGAWRKTPGQFYRPANGPALTAIADAAPGDLAVQQDSGIPHLFNGTIWAALSSSAVVQVQAGLADEAAVLAITGPSSGAQASTVGGLSYTFDGTDWRRQPGYVFSQLEATAQPAASPDGLGQAGTALQGDWLRETDTEALYSFDGTAWQPVGPSADSVVSATFASLPASADGSVAFVVDEARAYMRSGGVWLPAATTAFVAADQPAQDAIIAPKQGDLLWRSDTDALSLRVAGAWVRVNSSGGGTFTTGLANEAAVVAAGGSEGDEFAAMTGQSYIRSATELRRRPGFRFRQPQATAKPAASGDGTGLNGLALIGDTLFETDTRRLFEFDGTNWNGIDSARPARAYDPLAPTFEGELVRVGNLFFQADEDRPPEGFDPTRFTLVGPNVTVTYTSKAAMEADFANQASNTHAVVNSDDGTPTESLGHYTRNDSGWIKIPGQLFTVNNEGEIAGIGFAEGAVHGDYLQNLADGSFWARTLTEWKQIDPTPRVYASYALLDASAPKDGTEGIVFVPGDTVGKFTRVGGIWSKTPGQLYRPANNAAMQLLDAATAGVVTGDFARLQDTGLLFIRDGVNWEPVGGAGTPVTVELYATVAALNAATPVEGTEGFTAASADRNQGHYVRNDGGWVKVGSQLFKPVDQAALDALKVDPAAEGIAEGDRAIKLDDSKTYVWVNNDWVRDAAAAGGALVTIGVANEAALAADPEGSESFLIDGREYYRAGANWRRRPYTWEPGNITALNAITASADGSGLNGEAIRGDLAYVGSDRTLWQHNGTTWRMVTAAAPVSAASLALLPTGSPQGTVAVTTEDGAFVRTDANTWLSLGPRQVVFADLAERDAWAPVVADVCFVTGTNSFYAYDGATWQAVGGGAFLTQAQVENPASTAYGSISGERFGQGLAAQLPTATAAQGFLTDQATINDRIAVTQGTLRGSVKGPTYGPTGTPYDAETAPNLVTPNVVAVSNIVINNPPANAEIVPPVDLVATYETVGQDSYSVRRCFFAETTNLPHLAGLAFSRRYSVGTGWVTDWILETPLLRNWPNAAALPTTSGNIIVPAGTLATRVDGSLHRYDGTAWQLQSETVWRYTSGNVSIFAGQSWVIEGAHTLTLPAATNGQAIKLSPGNFDWATLGASISAPGATTVMAGQAALPNDPTVLTLVYKTATDNWVGFL